MAKVYIALGSNLGDRERHLLQGASDLAALPGSSALRVSSIYETAPMGPQDQPDFLNCACEINCTQDPDSLLDQLQLIERQHGRVHSARRWSARALDLDILLYAEMQLQSDTLQIPHPGIAERSFVLWPLHELQPELFIPGHGQIKKLMQTCPLYGIRKYQRGSDSG